MNSEKDDVSDLLVNNLVYVSPENLSLAVNRSYQKMYFQKQNYGQFETARCDLNSGTAYIDPENSYLKFCVQLTVASGSPDAYCSLGSGSAMNFIRTVTIRSKSGVELARDEFANVYSRINVLNTESAEYLRTVGSVEGWDVPSIQTGVFAGTFNLSNTSKFAYSLPLKRLSTFFDPKKNNLLPASLISGLSMEIIFENVNQSVVLIRTDPPVVPATVTGYIISDISLNCDCVQLTDDTQKTLNNVSASNGLEVTYGRIYTSINDVPNSTTNISAQIRKAVSNASHAVAVIMNPTAINNILVDSFKTLRPDFSSIQWRLGSLYFPNQPIQPVPNVYLFDIVDLFNMNKMTYNKFKQSHNESVVSYDMFKEQGCGSVCVSLERTQELELSGCSLNNSRVLELDGQFTSPANRSVYVFLVYNCVSRSYIDNVSVGI